MLAVMHLYFKFTSVAINLAFSYHFAQISHSTLPGNPYLYSR